ncbi:unnamed protein product [Aspergillus oryzae]|nr:unnamed protein product [Aspergillus oryzae]
MTAERLSEGDQMNMHQVGRKTYTFSTTNVYTLALVLKPCFVTYVGNSPMRANTSNSSATSIKYAMTTTGSEKPTEYAKAQQCEARVLERPDIDGRLQLSFGETRLDEERGESAQHEDHQCQDAHSPLEAQIGKRTLQDERKDHTTQTCARHGRSDRHAGARLEPVWHTGHPYGARECTSDASHNAEADDKMPILGALRRQEQTQHIEGRPGGDQLSRSVGIEQGAHEDTKAQRNEDKQPRDPTHILA